MSDFSHQSFLKSNIFKTKLELLKKKCPIFSDIEKKYKRLVDLQQIRQYFTSNNILHASWSLSDDKNLQSSCNKFDIFREKEEIADF